MRKPGSTAPFTFFFLVLPYGISSGFVSITLPFVLTRAGFSVALSASIVAIGVSANLWRFLWGPVADLTLSARRWYLIGLVTSAVSLLFLGLIPLHQNEVGILMAVVFVSQVAATLIVLPVGGLMAHTVGEEAKGRAAGWYQAGNLGGTGLGGGAGVWLAAHFSKEAAGGTLSVVMLASAAALYFVSDVRIVATESLGERMRILGCDILAMAHSVIPLFTIVLVMSPVGAGAMNNLWSAVAPDWRANPNTVAFVTGLLNGIVSVVGCVAGGWIADRIGRWWGLLRVRSCSRSRGYYYGRNPANIRDLFPGRSCLRVFRGGRVRCLFRCGAVCNRARRCFDKICNAVLARKYSGRLHDRIRRLGARPLWHGMDAPNRRAVRSGVHRVRSIGPSKDKRCSFAGSSIIIKARFSLD